MADADVVAIASQLIDALNEGDQKRFATYLHPDTA